MIASIGAFVSSLSATPGRPRSRRPTAARRASRAWRARVRGAPRRSPSLVARAGACSIGRGAYVADDLVAVQDRETARPRSPDGRPARARRARFRAGRSRRAGGSQLEHPADLVIEVAVAQPLVDRDHARVRRRRSRSRSARSRCGGPPAAAALRPAPGRVGGSRQRPRHPVVPEPDAPSRRSGTCEPPALSERDDAALVRQRRRAVVVLPPVLEENSVSGSSPGMSISPAAQISYRSPSRPRASRNGTTGPSARRLRDPRPPRARG